MCLYDSKRFRFTLKPIKVFKIVKILPDGTLESPIIGCPIEKHMFGGFGLPIKIKEEAGYYSYEFGKGFIHAYSSFHSALRHEKELNNKCPCFTIIVGYIPISTRYARERNPELCCDVICARRMIFPNPNKPITFEDLRNNIESI